MIEQKIQIPTASGTAEGILFRPKQEGRWPGVIQYTDIGGICVPTGCSTTSLGSNWLAVLGIAALLFARRRARS